MTHVTPKDLVTVKYIGELPTKVRPFLMGEKVDVKHGDKLEMDARQAATVLIDHLAWEKVSERKNDEGSSKKEEEKEDKKEPEKATKKK